MKMNEIELDRRERLHKAGLTANGTEERYRENYNVLQGLALLQQFAERYDDKTLIIGVGTHTRDRELEKVKTDTKDSLIDISTILAVNPKWHDDRRARMLIKHRYALKELVDEKILASELQQEVKKLTSTGNLHAARSAVVAELAKSKNKRNKVAHDQISEVCKACKEIGEIVWERMQEGIAFGETIEITAGPIAEALKQDVASTVESRVRQLAEEKDSRNKEDGHRTTEEEIKGTVQKAILENEGGYLLEAVIRGILAGKYVHPNGVKEKKDKK